MKRYMAILTNGIVKENPLLVLMIGLCSSLAVTTRLVNGVGMGVALTVVLVMSEIIISAFRKLTPESIRIPIFIIIIATFVTIVDLCMQAFTPDLSKSMGVFIPLIVVNCIIMGRVESYSYKNTVLESVFDGIGMGLGYSWVLCGISAIRELLGGGTILAGTGLEITVLPEAYRIGLLSRAPGGFLVFSMFIAVTFAIKRMQDARVKDTGPACCSEDELKKQEVQHG
ncbi:MAG: electron transport complex subunit RsxE [Spirochaetaceae bacterium]|jgi:electron transport complex protein RnfE|nr:electron transport complex subunit RsxE [Spirochaetaceae bacterium]